MRLQSQSGSTLVIALVGVALLGILIVAVSSLGETYSSARKRQEMAEAGTTVEDASVNALGDVFRQAPLSTSINCSNIPALFNNATIGTAGKLTVTSTIPAGVSGDRSDFAAAKTRCAANSGGTGGAGSPAYFCALFPTSTGAGSTASGSSFARSDQGFMEVKLSFYTLSDHKPISCAKLRQYALGAGAEISYRLYWKGHTSSKGAPTYNSLARTVVMDLTPGP